MPARLNERPHLGSRFSGNRPRSSEKASDVLKTLVRKTPRIPADCIMGPPPGRRRPRGKSDTGAY